MFPDSVTSWLLLRQWEELFKDGTFLFSNQSQINVHVNVNNQIEFHNPTIYQLHCITALIILPSWPQFDGSLGDFVSQCNFVLFGVENATAGQHNVIIIPSYKNAKPRLVAMSLGNQEAPRAILASGTSFREDLVIKLFLRPFFLFR